MAKRRSKSLLSSPYVKYGLYAAIAYFGYNWWTGQQNPLLGPQAPPPGTV